MLQENAGFRRGRTLAGNNDVAGAGNQPVNPRCNWLPPTTHRPRVQNRPGFVPVERGMTGPAFPTARELYNANFYHAGGRPWRSNDCRIECAPMILPQAPMMLHASGVHRTMSKLFLTAAPETITHREDHSQRGSLTERITHVEQNDRWKQRNTPACAVRRTPRAGRWGTSAYGSPTQKRSRLVKNPSKV
jgi:hypothetical protein